MVRVTVIPGLMVGDANLDGRVTYAMYVMQYKACFRELDQYQLLCADTNADGSVSAAAMHIMRFGADPDGTAGVLHKSLHDAGFHEGTIDPPVGP